MTRPLDADRLIVAWLETPALSPLDDRVVERAVGEARRRRRRGGLVTWLLGPRPWPRTSAQRRGDWMLRVTVVTLMLATLVGGAIAVGSRLLADPAPPPLPTVLPTVDPPVTPDPDAPPYESVVLRAHPERGPVTHIDVVMVRPTGAERLLRRIPVTVDGLDLPLTTQGTVSRNGWLAIATESPGGQPPVNFFVLFDLADPARPPMLVPHPEVIGPRWSSTDLLAISSAAERTPTGWRAIDIVDPRDRSTVGIGSPTLFGGGPSIVWASDGSGVMAGRATVVLADGTGSVPVGPDTLFDDPRVGRAGRTAEVCRAEAVGGCRVTAGASVRVGVPGGESTEWYASTDPSESTGDPVFGAPESGLGAGESLLLPILTMRGERQVASIVRLDAPFEARTLATIDLPAGVTRAELWDVAPDGSVMYLFAMTEAGVELDPIRLAADGTVLPLPAGMHAGYVRSAIAAAWPGEDPGTPSP